MADEKLQTTYTKSDSSFFFVLALNPDHKPGQAAVVRLDPEEAKRVSEAKSIVLKNENSPTTWKLTFAEISLLGKRLLLNQEPDATIAAAKEAEIKKAEKEIQKKMQERPEIKAGNSIKEILKSKEPIWVPLDSLPKGAKKGQIVPASIYTPETRVWGQSVPPERKRVAMK